MGRAASPFDLPDFPDAIEERADELWGAEGTRVIGGIRPSDFEILATGPTEVRDDCMRVP